MEVYLLLFDNKGIRLGAKFVLEALHSDAYEAFKKSNDLKMVIDRVISHAIKKKTKASNENSEKKSLERTASFSTAVALMTPIKPMLAMACNTIDGIKAKCPNGAYHSFSYCTLLFHLQQICGNKV